MAKIVNAFSGVMFTPGAGTTIPTTLLLDTDDVLVYYPVITNGKITYVWRKLPPIPTDIAAIPIL
jgi:hypothetical protein